MTKNKNTKANEMIVRGYLLKIAAEIASGVIPWNEFSMASFCNTKGCGSVRCIGGWLSRRMNLPPTENDPTYKVGVSPAMEQRLSRLFYVTHHKEMIDTSLFWSYIKKKDVIHAINNFLAGKAYPWQDFLDTKGL